MEDGMATTSYGKRLQRLCGEQNHRCCYCGVGFDDMRRGPFRATIDHVVPRGVGGSKNGWHNQVAACYRCNHERSSRDAHAFYQSVRNGTVKQSFYNWQRPAFWRQDCPLPTKVRMAAGLPKEPSWAERVRNAQRGMVPWPGPQLPPGPQLDRLIKMGAERGWKSE